MAKASCCFRYHLWLEVGASYYFGTLPWEGQGMMSPLPLAETLASP